MLQLSSKCYVTKIYTKKCKTFPTDSSQEHVNFFFLTFPMYKDKHELD